VLGRELGKRCSREDQNCLSVREGAETRDKNWSFLGSCFHQVLRHSEGQEYCVEYVSMNLFKSFHRFLRDELH